MGVPGVTGLRSPSAVSFFFNVQAASFSRLTQQLKYVFMDAITSQYMTTTRLFGIILYLLLTYIIILAFPPFSAFQACDKCGHGLIRRASLKLVIRAFLRFALIARKVAGGSFDIWLVLLLVANLFVFNQLLPFIRTNFLVGHECDFL